MGISQKKTPPRPIVTYCYNAYMPQSSNSFAIFEAIFLKLMELPEIRLNRTPFRDKRGSLQTSISHCTLLSSAGLPWTQMRRNFSLCSYSHLFASKTRFISSIIVRGSFELVVFILHVKRSARGLSLPTSFNPLLMKFHNTFRNTCKDSDSILLSRMTSKDLDQGLKIRIKERISI
jgi:hypothetical protein